MALPAPADILAGLVTAMNTAADALMRHQAQANKVRTKATRTTQLPAWSQPNSARAIETIPSMDISHSDICLNTPYFLRFAARSQWCGWVYHLVGAREVL